MSSGVDCRAAQVTSDGQEGKPRPCCERCQSRSVVPVLYGLRGDESLPDGREKQPAKFVRGGCMLRLKGPRWCCLDCGHRWPNGSDDDMGLTEIGV